MKFRKMTLLYIILLMAVVGLACNLSASSFDVDGEARQGVEDRIEATFQARTQQAQNDQGQSVGSQDPTPSPYPGDSSSHSLTPGSTFRGVDGITIAAAQGSLDAPVEVTIKKIEEPQTEAALGIKQVGSFYQLRANEAFQTKDNQPLFLAFPIPEEEAVDDLAVAMLGRKDEFHTDPENEEDYDEQVKDAWVFRSASVDQEDSLLVITFFSLPEEGRTFTVVRDESFSPSLSSRPQGPGLAKPDIEEKGPFFKAVCHPKAFDNVSWNCTKRDREAAATLLENAYKDHLELGFKKPVLYYSIRVVSSLPNDVPNTDTGAREYTISIADCTWMTNRWGDGVIGKYLGTSGSVSFQACYNGSNVNWRGGKATSADWVENTIYHEYFHATQWAYSGFRKVHQGWFTEGTARASEDSHNSMRRGGGGWRDIDVPLSNNDQIYRAQDFWVFTGKHLNRGLDYLIPFLENGADTQSVDRVLENTYGQTYQRGLSSAYWPWIKNQAFENSAGGQCALNTRALNISGKEHELMTSTITGPETVTLEPLQSKVVRFNIFRLSDDPAVKHQFSLRAKASSGPPEAFSNFYFKYDENTNQCISRPERSSVGVELPAGAEYIDHYALIANGSHQSNRDFTLSVRPQKYEIRIIQPGGASSVTQGSSKNFRAVFKKNGSNQGTQQIKWTVGKPLSGGGSAVATGSDVNLSTDQIGGQGTYDIYANHVGNPPREAIYDSVTVSVQAAEAPDVRITHPADGEEVYATSVGGSYEYGEDNTVIFTARGEARDARGNAITGNDLIWSWRCQGCSAWNRNGRGESQEFQLRDNQCAQTEYQIRLVAWDNFGNKAQHVIDILVNVTGC